MRVSSFSEIEAEFIELVHAMVWCSMATLDTKSRPRSLRRSREGVRQEMLTFFRA
jgi:hypothetical protein